MPIQTLAFCEAIDTGEIELEVTRDADSDQLSVGASIFCASVAMADVMLIATALCNVPPQGVRVVVLSDGNEVGIGASPDSSNIWINCAPFHLRLSIETAGALANTLQVAYLRWRNEQAAREAA